MIDHRVRRYTGGVDRMLDDAQATGVLRGSPTGFTNAYLHTPDELAAEVVAAGLGLITVLGVEGPSWLLSAAELDACWVDDARWAGLLEAARRLESEPAVIGASAHMLAVARRP